MKKFVILSGAPNVNLVRSPFLQSVSQSGIYHQQKQMFNFVDPIQRFIRVATWCNNCQMLDFVNVDAISQFAWKPCFLIHVHDVVHLNTV